MTIAKLEPKRELEIIEIDGSLESMQDVVGGYIEIVPWVKGLVLVVNEEGKLLGLDYNFTFGNDIIVGTAFFAREDGEDLTDLTDNDIDLLKQIAFF